MSRTTNNIAVVVLLCCTSVSVLVAQNNQVDSLACLQSNDGEIRFDTSGVLGIDTYSGQYYVGDAWDWFDMYNYATWIYLSFPLPQVPAEQRLTAATFHINLQYCVGNSYTDIYPTFEFTWGTVTPNCLVSHVNYGPTLDITDFTTSNLQSPANLMNSNLPGWNILDVTEFVQDDLAAGRDYVQLKIRLEYNADWDGVDDLLLFYGAAITGYNPWLEVEYAPISETPDESVPALHVKAYPNPFQSDLKVCMDGKNPGQDYLDIFNLRGQRVKRITLSGRTDTQSVIWDGRDEVGQSVPPGVYLLRQQNGRTLKVLKQP